jgi:hypothetical protein
MTFEILQSGEYFTVKGDVWCLFRSDPEWMSPLLVATVGFFTMLGPVEKGGSAICESYVKRVEDGTV